MVKGFYVSALYGTKRALLCGPFDTLRAALMMVPAVTRAAQRTDDPRFAFASFGTCKVVAERLKPGTLPLEHLRIEDLIWHTALYYT